MTKSDQWGAAYKMHYSEDCNETKNNDKLFSYTSVHLISILRFLFNCLFVNTFENLVKQFFVLSC